MKAREKTLKLSRMMRRAVKGAVLLSLVAACLSGTGCAATTSRAYRSVDMDDIRALEGEIEQNRGVASGTTTCQDRCRAAAAICDASVNICDIASQLAEVEALEICRRSENTCHEARRRVDDACTCPR